MRFKVGEYYLIHHTIFFPMLIKVVMHKGHKHLNVIRDWYEGMIPVTGVFPAPNKISTNFTRISESDAVLYSFMTKEQIEKVIENET